MSTRRVETFELTSSSDRREFEKLVNDPKVKVNASADFFAVSTTPDGVIPVVTRVLDYQQADKGGEFYTPPVA